MSGTKTSSWMGKNQFLCVAATLGERSPSSTRGPQKSRSLDSWEHRPAYWAPMPLEAWNGRLNHCACVQVCPVENWGTPTSFEVLLMQNDVSNAGFPHGNGAPWWFCQFGQDKRLFVEVSVQDFSSKNDLSAPSSSRRSLVSLFSQLLPCTRHRIPPHTSHQCEPKQ